MSTAHSAEAEPKQCLLSTLLPTEYFVGTHLFAEYPVSTHLPAENPEEYPVSNL